MKRLLISLSIIFFLASPLFSQENEKAVLQTVDLLFEAIHKRDTSLASSILHPDGRFVAMTENGRYIAMSHKEYIHNLAKGKGKAVERYWDAEVHIRGHIATVWAPYDFYVNDQFSHCGIDALDLVKIEGKWIIVGGIFTVEKNSCEDLNLPEEKE
jgi:hypothetical protein